MKSLARRSAEYYFMQGLKMFGLIMGLQLILAIEWIIMGVEETDLIGYVTQSIVIFSAMFMVMFNTLYTVYGPNWYDSIVLSMGARRKDVFRGQIIQQVTCIALCTIVNLAICIIFNHVEFIGYTILSAAVAFLFGVAGTVIGYKIKRFGKVVIFIILMIITCIGAALGALTALGKDLVFTVLSSGPLFPVIGIGTIIAFILLEIWAYKLNSKSMVS